MNVFRALNAVFVLPEYSGRANVVRRVHWLLTFEEDGFRSQAFVETFLNVDDITNFIPANEIGTERVLQWAFAAQGGAAFVETIRPYHADQIAYQKQCAGQNSYTDGFDFVVQSEQTSVPSSVL
jgi:hypothetical protein